MTISADDFSQYVFGGGGPDKRLGIFVVVSNISIDGGDQFGYAGKHAATQAILGEAAEEPLDHVEPRGRGGGEMHVSPS